MFQICFFGPASFNEPLCFQRAAHYFFFLQRQGGAQIFCKVGIFESFKDSRNTIPKKMIEKGNQNIKKQNQYIKKGKKQKNDEIEKRTNKIISIQIIIKGLKLPNRIHATTKRGNSRSFMYIGETGYYSNLPYTYILLIHTICKYYRIALCFPLSLSIYTSNLVPSLVTRHSIHKMNINKVLPHFFPRFFLSARYIAEGAYRPKIWGGQQYCGRHI